MEGLEGFKGEDAGPPYPTGNELAERVVKGMERSMLAALDFAMKVSVTDLLRSGAGTVDNQGEAQVVEPPALPPPSAALPPGSSSTDPTP